MKVNTKMLNWIVLKTSPSLSNTKHTKITQPLGNRYSGKFEIDSGWTDDKILVQK